MRKENKLREEKRRGWIRDKEDTSEEDIGKIRDK